MSSWRDPADVPSGKGISAVFLPGSRRCQTMRDPEVDPGGCAPAAADGPDLLDLLTRSYQQEGNLDEVRYWMVAETAPKPLDHPRGSKFAYSNLGYAIAGAVLERTGKRPPALVSSDIIKKLHHPVIDTGLRENAPPGTPKTGGYGLGWGQFTVDWAPAPVVTHSGSNGMNLAIAMFWPETDFGFVMMTNIAGTAADRALVKLAANLYKNYSGEPSSQGL